MHPFDASLEIEPAGPETGVFRARTSEGYRNAIGPFGGWSAALLLKSVLAMPQARGAPLALDAVFMGPIDGGALETRVFALRQNRSVGFWRAELWQHDRMCAHAQVTLSSPRTGATLQDVRFPQVPSPDTVQTYVNPRTPVPWIEQYVFKPATGLLFSGDHLLPRISPNIALMDMPGGDLNPLSDFMTSLELVGKLSVDEVLPAHEYRFAGLEQRVRQLRAHHEVRLEELARHVAENPGATTYELATLMT